jgi:hypothetical protein
MDTLLLEFERPGEDGLSFVLTRSPRGEKICGDAESRSVIVRQPRELADIWRSHGQHRLSNRDFRALSSLDRFGGRGVPTYDLRLPCDGFEK